MPSTRLSRPFAASSRHRPVAWVAALLGAALVLSGVGGSEAAAATVSGQVRTQAGFGLPDVAMTWRDDGTNATTESTSDASGNYTVELADGTYTLTLTEPNSGTVATIPEVVVSGNSSNRNFVLVLAVALPPITISGTAMRDDTDGPAVDMQIEFRNLTTNEYFYPRTGVDGAYSFEYQPPVGMPYGNWRVRGYVYTMADLAGFPSGTMWVRQSMPVAGDTTLNFTVRSFTFSGKIVRCDEDGAPTAFAADGVQMLTRMSYGNTFSATGVVSPVDGTYSTRLLQTTVDPNYISATANISARLLATGYCAPFEGDLGYQTISEAPQTLDADGNVVVHDVVVDRCLPVVPLMRTRVTDIDGQPLGNVEIEVYNETTGTTVVAGSTRYTESDTGNLATFGRACFGVSEGVLRVYFNSRNFNGCINADGQYVGGCQGALTPRGRWQVNGFSMPSTGLDIGDRAIPTLFFEGTMDPPLPNRWLYAYLNWSSSYGNQSVQTDSEGRYRFAIIPSEEIRKPYSPTDTNVYWYIDKDPGFGSQCDDVPCVWDRETLPQDETAGYPQGATSTKTTIRYTRGALLTGSFVDWSGQPNSKQGVRLYTREPFTNRTWSQVYYANYVGNSLWYDYDGDETNDGFQLWVPPRLYYSVRAEMPSYGAFPSPYTAAPHSPLGRTWSSWLTDFLVPPGGATLIWDTRDFAHEIRIRVLTSLGLGIAGTEVRFDNSRQWGRVFDYRGWADMVPFGGQAGSPIDHAVQFQNVSTSRVDVFPPSATGFDAFFVNEGTGAAGTLTYIFPVENPNDPLILSGDIVARTDHSLTAQFEADQLVDGRFCCRFADEAPSCTATPELSSGHTLELLGLAPSTTYLCHVCGTNNAGRQGCSDEFPGTTLSACDAVAPQLSEFAYSVSDRAVNVTWSSNEPCLGAVVVDGDESGAILEQQLGVAHGVIVGELEPSTEYVLSVSCTDTCGNTRTVTNPVTTLETQAEPDTEAPVCTGVLADVGQAFAVFQISCNEPATVDVQCSDAATFQIYLGQSNTFAMVAAVSVTGLTPATTYECGANARDAFNNQLSFGLPDVTTLAADVVLPMIITAGPEVSTSDTTARVTWSTGTADGDSRASSSRVWWTPKGEGACPAVVDDSWETVLDTRLVADHRLDLAGLAPDTIYCYQVRSVGLGDSADSAVLEFTTLGTPVELAIVDVTVATDEDSGCENGVFTITLSKPGAVVLRVGVETTVDGDGEPSLVDPQIAFGSVVREVHTLALADLIPGSRHYYSVLAYDLDNDTVRRPSVGFDQFTNCGGLPNAAPTVVGTGGPYDVQCDSGGGATVALTATVRDDFACLFPDCRGDEPLSCAWLDTQSGDSFATAQSVGATPGEPAEDQTCSAEVAFPAGTHFLRLAATEPEVEGETSLTGVSSIFQVTVRDTTAPCINAGPDVAWEAKPATCFLPDGSPGVKVDVLDLHGDGSVMLAERPVVDQEVCGGYAVFDACDDAPTVSTLPAPHNVAVDGPHVFCVGYGVQQEIIYRATDAVGNTGTSSITVTVADRCEGVTCGHLDTDCKVGVCNPATGDCAAQNRVDLTPCDDDDVCTVSDVCRQGLCGGVPKCEFLDSELLCRQGVCIASTGECTSIRVGPDADGDGTPDSCDECPDDALKIAPGPCGCGVADVDSDGDGTLDCGDGCPHDPLKTAPGPCGCGVAETDLDVNGVADCLEDEDGDGIPDGIDNCVTVSNADQVDADGDGIGDACDTCTDKDEDGHGVATAACVVGEGGCQHGCDDCDDDDDEAYPGNTEVCDGKDNSCDGLADAADPDLDRPLCPEQRGVCEGARASRDRCVGGAWQPCATAEYAAAADPEVYSASGGDPCDGVDNDCDGEVDEGHVALLTACGVGGCVRIGQLACEGGQVTDTCVDGPPAANDATCNGVDDDCDGGTDEDFTSGEATCGVGACARTAEAICVDGALVGDCTPGEPLSDVDTTCDGVDDDCDGGIDEDFEGAETSCGVGACAALGEEFCVQGSVVDTCKVGTASLSDSDCDGVDDDCDGETDEDFPVTGIACGVGACVATGTRECVAGAVVDLCTPAEPGVTLDLTCDGVDDDCDGETDEDFAVQATTCGLGVCAASGQRLCVEGEVTDTCAEGAKTGLDDDCDGLDDDCDGATDEHFLAYTTHCGVGGCLRTGERQCLVGGTLHDTCVPGTPTSEVCDGVDNDCDGLVDSADPSLLRIACTRQAGVCAGSTRPASLCVNGAWLSCSDTTYGQHAFPLQYVPLGQDTSCDGVDNDCDGHIDGNYVATPTTCGVGRCAGGTGQLACQGGVIVDTCDPDADAVAERCNGVDDDCDGQTDELWPELGQGCDGPDEDLCASGSVRCSADGLGAVCDEPEGTSSMERCDGVDNDCDGLTDEGCDEDGDDYCDAGMVCVVGVTIDACPAGCGDCDDGASGVNPGAAERCDGVDNDCDGLTDEGCDEDGDGWCTASMACDPVLGAATCPNGCGDCDDLDGAAWPGAPERCSGKDDDCNGLVDDGFEVGGSCEVGLGPCRTSGQLVCNSAQGGVVCDAVPAPGSVEICDGVDNDCNGLSDEGFPVGEPCTVGDGVCAGLGAWICAGGGVVCSATQGPPSVEVCDGLDNDCDGETDEAPDGGSLCTVLETVITSHPQAISGSDMAEFTYVDPNNEAQQAFECSVDGGDWVRCDGGALALSGLADGVHTFLVRSFNVTAGTFDTTPAFFSWRVDRSVPDTIIALAPSDPSQSSTAQFGFSATVDDVQGYFCALDPVHPSDEPPPSGAYAPCAALTAFEELDEGAHALWVYVVTQAGVADPTPAVHHWTIDLSAPETEITSGPEAVTTSTTATFAYQSPEAGQLTAFRCRFDGGAWEPCDGGAVSYDGLVDGEYLFEVAAVAAGGVVDPTPAAWRWVVDTTPPDTLVTIGPSDPSQTGEATFAFASNELVVTYRCALDPASTPPAAEDYAECASVHAVSGLADGGHTLWVVAVDEVGLWDPSPATWTWVVDSTAPETEITTRPPLRTGPSDGAMFVYRSPGSPGLDTFECRLDGGPWTPCPGGVVSYTAESLDVGDHAFLVRACSAISGLCDPTPAVASWEVTESACPLDVTAPDIACPEDVVAECGGEGGAAVALGQATASDPCGVGAVTADAPDVFPVGLTPVVFTAVDGNGNRSSCVTEVRVVDTTPPLVTCASALELTTDPATCGALVTVPAAAAEDACFGDDVIVYGDAPALFPVGTTTVTWSGLDPAGRVATCTVAVTVADEEPAELACADARSVEAPPEACAWSGVVEATARDNCAVEITTLSQDNTYAVGLSDVEFVSVDASGNEATCVTALEVRDVTAPAVSCPEGADADVASLLGRFEASATDACGAEAWIIDAACESLDAAGEASEVAAEDCPVALVDGGLEVTGRLADGVLRVRLVARGEDPSGNAAEVHCALLFDPDADGDGVVDAEDNCPAVANPDQEDGDGDGVGDACDGCPEASDAAQTDSDGDGTGDACDVCPEVFDPEQADADGDGVGDACDNCPLVANADQEDGDGSGIGDACQDVDGDGVIDLEDNCPVDANPDQLDSDGDGLGDTCDPDPYEGFDVGGGGGVEGCAGGGTGALAALLALALVALFARTRRRRRDGGGLI